MPYTASVWIKGQGGSWERVEVTETPLKGEKVHHFELGDTSEGAVLWGGQVSEGEPSAAYARKP